MASQLQSTINSDMYINGALSSLKFKAASGSITDDSIQANAQINYSKLQHSFSVRHSQIGTVATKTELVHLAQAAGNIVAVHVLTTTPPTSSDSVVIDVQKSTGGGAFATVLTSTLTLNSSTTTRTVYSPAISTTTYSANDCFEVIVTVTGSSCSGLIVTLVLAENAQ